MKTQAKNFNQFMLLIILIIASSFTATSAERIDGNGTLITKQKTVPQFYKVEVETFCNVVVNSGAMPMVSLKVDENLQELYEIKVVNGVLKISTEKWPEPSHILLTVQVPFITAFSNSGWGKIKINQLNTEKFILKASTGYVTMKGKVENLIIHAGTGKIDATRVESNSIQLTQDSHGKTQLGTSKVLTIAGELGTVYYQGTPRINREKANKSLRIKSTETSLLRKGKRQALQYVNVNIKNNSLGWNSFIIRGPKMSPFSYGFSMFPYTIKKEKIPVGTKFFANGLLGMEKLLISIEAKDEGTTVNLFK